jgi:hypothetical protein
MKGARTLVFDTSNRAGRTAHFFPLTPALSLGEREKGSPLLSASRHQGKHLLSVVGTSRCDFPARGLAGGTDTCAASGSARVAPLNAARTAQRAIPTIKENRYGGEGERSFRKIPKAMFSAGASV